MDLINVATVTNSYCPDSLQLVALKGIPLIVEGDVLTDVLVRSLESNRVKLKDNDVLVIAQKIVSKAEGQLIDLDQVSPSKEALRRAKATGKDPRLVELILRESVEIVRQTDNLIITENRLGLVMANAGIDQSNVGNGTALLLPENPDRSAMVLRTGLQQLLDIQVGIIIADSIGRAWRNGIVGHAIGAAGVQTLMDLRQAPDLYNKQLKVTEVAVADEIAAAASLLMGQAGEGIPIVLVRGFGPFNETTNAQALLRPKNQDLFR